MEPNREHAQKERDIFATNFRRILKMRGKTQSDVVADLEITSSTVSDWANAKKYPRVDKMQALANYLGVVISDLREEPGIHLPSNIIPMPSTYKVPLIGTIACGQPILAVENADEVVEVPEHVHADFALRCKGESMVEARIYDGDIVYIRSQPEVENGEIAAVRIGEEATLKKVRRYPDMIILEPANHTMDPLVYRGEEINDIQILGRAVAFTSTIR